MTTFAEGAEDAAHMDLGPGRILVLEKGDEFRVLPVLSAAEALTPLARLGLWVLNELREHAADIDGGDVQEKAEAFGVVAEQPADPSSCGDWCPCAEAGAEVCYRDTDATRAARLVLAPPVLVAAESRG